MSARQSEGVPAWVAGRAGGREGKQALKPASKCRTPLVLCSSQASFHILGYNKSHCTGKHTYVCMRGTFSRSQVRTLLRVELKNQRNHD